MARPEKMGMEYYPKDVDQDLDDKLGMIIGEYQSKGEIAFDKILCWIYKHEGYFMKWDEEVQLRFLRRYSYCGFSVSFLRDVVQRFIKWGLFDKTVFDASQILTSKRIQKTWVDATRKRMGRKIRSDLWLIEVSSGLQAEETAKKAEETIQSKVKESKEEESKVKGKGNFSIPPPGEVKIYFFEKTNNENFAAAQTALFLDHYISNGWKVGRNPMKDWKAAVRNWISNKDFNTSKNNENGSSKTTARQSADDAASRFTERVRKKFEDAIAGGADGL